VTALDHAKFLAAVLAEPHNDAPRLGYADWLEETGEPELAARGEFIRVQVEIARLQKQVKRYPPYPSRLDSEVVVSPPRLPALRRREGELLGPNWPAWCGSEWAARCHCENLWPAPPCPTPSITFRRGFVAEITCTCADWIGGPCRRCRGTGRAMHLHESPWRPDPSRPYPHGTGGQTTTFTECPDCSGTGRTQGVGPALVRATPLERVALSGRRPMRLHTTEAYQWVTTAGELIHPWHVPGELSVPMLLQLDAESLTLTQWDTPDEATAFLGRAAIRWARSVEPAAGKG
jgi:uncharacterized protein (TIGR02996 family)